MIRSTILFTILTAAIVCPLAADTYDERTLVWIPLADQADKAFILSSRIDVIDAGRDWVKALLRKEEFRLLEEHGLTPEILFKEMERDRALWREADAAAEALAPNFYYTASKFNTTNPGSNTLMKHLLDLSNAHPDITRLYDIGNSYGGTYDILAIKVTKNPDLVEPEPKIRIYGNIHGDEKGGLMVACEALDWILANYPADASARKLVDESELWFIPMGNPNGNAANSRYNGNSIDLNRNFWGPAGSSDGTGDFSEPETQAIRDLTLVMGKRFTNSLSFHGGAACFNSLWNYAYDAPTDEPVFWSTRTPGDGCSSENGCLTLAPHGLAKAYQDGCTTAGFWYTNGADWYQTYGDTNDWSYGQWSDLDTTLEVTVTKTPAASTIPTFVAEHRQATVNYMLKTFQNISGVMTDQASGAPLDGTVAATCTASPTIAVPHDYQAVFTDPVAGDFHRVLQPGTYTITCSAPGYMSTVISGLVVTADTQTVANCALSATGLSYAASGFSDLCGGGGPGSGNAYLDAGETAVLQVTLSNPGSVAATGVAATLTTSTPGVTISQATASFADVEGGGTAVSQPPHFRISVGTGMACGTAIAFNLHLSSAQGAWDDAFTLTTGQIITSTPIAMFMEGFDGTAFPPNGWTTTVVGPSSPAPAWARVAASTNPTGIGPHTGAAMAEFNSYHAQSGGSNRLARTANLNIAAGAASASAVLWVYHEAGYASYADRIVVQTSPDGTTWTDRGAVNRYDGSTGWKQHIVDLSALIGAGNFRIGFLGISGYGNDTYLDDVSVIYAAAPSCQQTACTTTSAPPPVKGTGAGAVKIAKGSDNTLNVTYDAVSCGADKIVVLYNTIGTWTGYAGCAQPDGGNGGSTIIDSRGQTSTWYNLVWTQGTTAGHPGFATGGARSWNVGTLCGMNGDDKTHSTCP